MKSTDMSVHDDAKVNMAEELEKVEDDSPKAARESFTPEEEKRLIRKLDFWYRSSASPSMERHTFLLTSRKGLFLS